MHSNSLRPQYGLILPVCNERESLAKLLPELLAWTAQHSESAQWHIALGLNGCTDSSRDIASKHSVLLAETSQKGYGHGCLAAIEELDRSHPETEAYVFLAADGGQPLEAIPQLLALHRSGSPFVIGQRTLKISNWASLGAGRMLPNLLLGLWATLLTARPFSDLGPLRLIEKSLFHRMRQREMQWGWTIEQQILASRLDIAIATTTVRELPRRAGEQKVSGRGWRHSLRVGGAIAAAGWRARWRRPL